MEKVIILDHKNQCLYVREVEHATEEAVKAIAAQEGLNLQYCSVAVGDITVSNRAANICKVGSCTKVREFGGYCDYHAREARAAMM